MVRSSHHHYVKREVQALKHFQHPFISEYYGTFQMHTYIHTYQTIQPFQHLSKQYPDGRSFNKVYIHTYKQTNIQTCLHTYLHTYKQTNKQTNIQTCLHTYLLTYIYTYIHTYIHTYNVIYDHDRCCSKSAEDIHLHGVYLRRRVVVTFV